MNTSRLENLVYDIHELAYTDASKNNSYNARRSRQTLNIFLNDLCRYNGFHTKVARTVLDSMDHADDFVARCSNKQAQFLAEAAIKYNVYFVKVPI